MRATALAGRAIALLLVVTGCNTAPAPTAAVRGKVQFEKYCAPCHGENGHGNPDVGAPSIAGLPDWYIERQLVKYRAGIRGAHFDDIEGFRMRPMALALNSDTAITDVSAYVGQLKSHTPPTTLDGNASKGKAHYGTCTACHQADGSGNEALGSPPLTGLQDWYLLGQLKKFKSGVRAYDERDTWGATMAPMANSLTDESAMKDVVAHIQTLRK